MFFSECSCTDGTCTTVLTGSSHKVLPGNVWKLTLRSFVFEPINRYGQLDK